MIAFLTNVAPIALGFVAKLFALKSQAAAENQKLMIQIKKQNYVLVPKNFPCQQKVITINLLQLIIKIFL